MEISIVVPVYNSEKTLIRCVSSILRQSFRDFELILVDDGSEDQSGTICNMFSTQDNRVRVLRLDKNSGVSAARNVGLDSAQGKYLMLVDSDDELEQGTLQTYIESTQDGLFDIIIGGLCRIEADKPISVIGVNTSQVLCTDIWDKICLGNEIFGYAGGKLTRLSLIKENSIRFNTKMHSQEDLDFFLSVYSVCEYARMIECSGYLYYYAPGKRVPQLYDYIANQLKMLQLARSSASEEACSQVERRIYSLLYSLLYGAVKDNCMLETLKRLELVKGLDPVLQKAVVQDKHSFIAKLVGTRKHNAIYCFFKFRLFVHMIIHGK